MDGKIIAEGSSASSGLPTTTVVNLSQEVSDLTGKVHQLPCCIKHDGPTPVSHYFKPKPTEMEVDGLRVDEAHFRGRKLHGTSVSLPQGYSGFVLGKKSSRGKNDATSSNSWETTATFQDVTVWNHDAVPSKDDTFLRAFHWFAVADTLHKTVTAEDLESASFG